MSIDYIAVTIPFQPVASISETLEWRTDVITSRNGNEQRVQLRDHPRRFLEYTYWFSDPYHQSMFDSIIYRWRGKLYGVPIWSQVRTFDGPLSSGSGSITCDTTNSEIVNGGIVIIWQDNDTYEIRNVDTKTDSSITLRDATTVAFTASTLHIAPVTSCTISRMAEQSIYTHNAGSTEIRFETTALPEDPTGTAPTQYNSMDLFTDFYLTGQGSKATLQHQVERVDNKSGAFELYRNKLIPDVTYLFDGLYSGRSDIWQFRYWLYRRKGRLVPFYAPTWRKDISLYSSIGAADTTIQIKPIGWEKSYEDDHRKYLLFRWQNKTNIVREITGVATSANYETLTIDSSLGLAGGADDFRSISVLRMCRLGADRIIMTYPKADIMKTSFPIIEVIDQDAFDDPNAPGWDGDGAVAYLWYKIEGLGIQVPDLSSYYIIKVPIIQMRTDPAEWRWYEPHDMSGGTVHVSREVGSYEGEKAADDDQWTFWSTGGTVAQNTEWWAYEFASATVIREIRINGSGGIAGVVPYMFTNFTVKASNDSTTGLDGTWTTLKTGLQPNGWVDKQIESNYFIIQGDV